MSVAEGRVPAFQLVDAFFTTIQFRRVSEVPDPLNVRFNVQIRVHDDRLPEELQVDLKLETVEDQPLTMVLEVVGLFKATEDQLESGSSGLSRFVNERAVLMLWPYLVQMTRLTTSQMGISPVKLPTPSEF